jgi:hypothetical protein
VLLAFIGAIFDLAQLLARGQTATNFGQEMGSVAGLIDAREVCFAVSIAFRLLFFWALSSRRQLGELIADGKEVNSASWTRFGVVGRLVQWLLLLVVIGVLVLQAIWRLVPSQSNFSMTYGASAAAEIVLSTILAAKLLWNCGKTTIKPRMSLARRYSLPALALFMGMGMAIGNIIYCECCGKVKGLSLPLNAVVCQFPFRKRLLAAFFKPWDSIFSSCGRLQMAINGRPRMLRWLVCPTSHLQSSPSASHASPHCAWI